MKKKLEKILQELYDNDDSVPDADNSRCTELNWFSSGVKDNIVIHIANQMEIKLQGSTPTKQVE